MERKIKLAKEKIRRGERIDPDGGELIDSIEEGSWDYRMSGSQDCLYIYINIFKKFIMSIIL